MSIMKTDFLCPYCTHIHNEDDYYTSGLSWKNNKIVIIPCKHCHRQMQITITKQGFIIAQEYNEKTK